MQGQGGKGIRFQGGNLLLNDGRHFTTEWAITLESVPKRVSEGVIGRVVAVIVADRHRI